MKNKFNKSNSFDCRAFDEEIAKKVDKTFKNYKFEPKKVINNNRVAFLATSFYDMGGHTEWAKKIAEMLNGKYELTTFLTQKNLTYKNAPQKIKLIEKYSNVEGINQGENLSFRKDLLSIFNKINEFAPKVIFSFLNTNDVYGAAVLYLLHKYTDIKIVLCNHGSHFPTLGMSFVDAIGGAFDLDVIINKKYRKQDKSIYLGMIDGQKKDIVDITNDEKAQIRKKLGIKEGNYFTLSGATSYKFFDNNIPNEVLTLGRLCEKKSLNPIASSYFTMIKKLLEEEPNLEHVVITELIYKQKKVFDSIFNNSNVKDRIKIIPFTPEYSKIFQSCDLFIDSAPIGSALTHVELMKHKKISVVFENKLNPLHSFQEYFPKDYKYKYTNLKDMQQGVLELLHNEQKRKETENYLYNHYLNTFEGSVAIETYINVIENADDIEKLYRNAEPIKDYEGV